MADVKYERIFCAEQINVPPNLPAVMKELTKAVGIIFLPPSLYMNDSKRQETASAPR